MFILITDLYRCEMISVQDHIHTQHFIKGKNESPAELLDFMEDQHILPYDKHYNICSQVAIYCRMMLGLFTTIIISFP